MRAVEVLEDAPYSATIADSATDTDGDPLTFSKVSGPAWLAVSSNGDISGVPRAGDVGLNQFTVEVEDGFGGTAQGILKITVIHVNHPPVFGSDPISKSSGAEYQAYYDSIAGDAADSDTSDTLVFTKTSGPVWLSVATSGALSGMPTHADVGTNQFAVRVTDAAGASDEATLWITIAEVNAAPSFTSGVLRKPDATEDLAYGASLAGDASDPDPEDTLTFEKAGGPAWLAVFSDGVLSGTPRNGDVGENVFTVFVRDNSGGSDQATVRIDVINTNDSPAFTSDTLVKPVATRSVAYAQSLAADASDPDQNDALAFFKASGPSWLTVAPDGALAGTPTNDDVGANQFTVRVVDSADAYDEAIVRITVVNTNDAPRFAADSFSRPNASAGSPYSDSIAGTASDPDVGDVLTYAKAAGPGWLTVGPNGGLSGTPTKADAGVNTFTIRVVDQAAAYDEAALEITVTRTNLQPSVAVTTPALDRSVPSGTAELVFAGAAEDPDGTVVAVEYRVRCGDWETANGTATWDFVTALEVGDNLVEVRAKDDEGAYSPIVTRKIASAGDFSDNLNEAPAIAIASGQAMGTNVNATKEAGEPDHAGNPGGASVWWSWTAPSAGVMSVDTENSDFDTLLAVYTGVGVASLKEVASSNDAGAAAAWSSVSFQATSGVTYFVAVDGKDRAMGSIVQNWSFTPDKPLGTVEVEVTPVTAAWWFSDRDGGIHSGKGDDTVTSIPAGAIVLSWDVLKNYDQPTTNPDVKTLAEGGVVRFEGVYRRHTGTVTVDVTPDTASWSFTDGDGGVHSGAGDRTVSNVPTGAIAMTWGALTGYDRPSDSPAIKELSKGDSIVFTGVYRPSNDVMLKAAPLTEDIGQIASSNATASKDAGEPNHAGNSGGHSLWWSWTAPGLGVMTIDTEGGDFDTLLAVYTGVDIASLTQVASNDDATPSDGWSLTAFDTTTGTTYRVAMDGKDGASGDFVLTWAFTPAASSATVLSNISTRGWVGAGADVMIAGFIIKGDAPKKVALTGWGPSLAGMGVGDCLANPKLTVYSDQTLVGVCDDWQTSEYRDAVSAAGLEPKAPLESAIVLTLNPGAYTAILSGVDGGSGSGVVAAWDIDAGRPALENISTRGWVGAGDQAMIAGFIITGETPKRVGVTGWGPSMAALGVPNVLANPVLTVYSGHNAIGTCDDWQASGYAQTVTEAGLAPADSREAAIVLTLAPGAYTAILSGADGGTGNGLVAVWDLE